MRRVLGLLIGAAMAISAGTTGFAVDYEDEDPILPPIYGGEYYNHAKLTYEELMAMKNLQCMIVLLYQLNRITI